MILVGMIRRYVHRWRSRWYWSRHEIVVIERDACGEAYATNDVRRPFWHALALFLERQPTDLDIPS